jgi:hypothetical protein
MSYILYLFKFFAIAVKKMALLSSTGSFFSPKHANLTVQGQRAIASLFKFTFVYVHTAVLEV